MNTRVLISIGAIVATLSVGACKNREYNDSKEASMTINYAGSADNYLTESIRANLYITVKPGDTKSSFLYEALDKDFNSTGKVYYRNKETVISEVTNSLETKPLSIFRDNTSKPINDPNALQCLTELVTIIEKAENTPIKEEYNRDISFCKYKDLDHPEYIYGEQVGPQSRRIIELLFRLRESTKNNLSSALAEQETKNATNIAKDEAYQAEKREALLKDMKEHPENYKLCRSFYCHLTSFYGK